MSSSSSEPIAAPSTAQSCARIKKPGYIARRHMNLYGEHIELVSDPFEDGDCVVVHAVCESSPTVPTIDLPVSILAGWKFQDSTDPIGQN